MYESLKEWMTCPVIIKPFLRTNAYADKEYGDPVDILAYVVGGAEVINDASGNAVVSTTQVYIDPEIYMVNPQDRLIVDGAEKDIISVTNWHDGNTGTITVSLVYL